MNKTLDDYSFSFLSQDICKNIDNSHLSRRIAKLDPSNLSNRPKTNESKKIKKLRMKIIPELRGPIEILQSRLNSTYDLKNIPRPCNRINIANKNSLSPGTYNLSCPAVAGHEFSKSPRMQDHMTHNIDSTVYSELVTIKPQSFQNNYKERNKKSARNISDYTQTILEKNKKHNEMVSERSYQIKVKKFRDQQDKKTRFYDKIQNMMWKQDKDLLFSAKKQWARIIVSLGIAALVYRKTIRKKYLSKRSARLRNFLKVISAVIGKFGLMLKRNRKSEHYKNVKTFALPICEYLTAKHKTFCHAVSKYTWKMVNSNHLLLLQAFWKRSIYRIQKNVRKYFKIREARIIAMNKLYAKYYVPLNHKDNRRVTIIPLIHVPDVIVTSEVNRRKIIISYLRQYLHDFAKEELRKEKDSERAYRKGILKIYTERTKFFSFSIVSGTGLHRNRRSFKRNTEIFKPNLLDK